MPPVFLGLDSSTQALKASLLSAELDVIDEAEVRFDRDLAFGTRGGVLHGPEGSGEVYSPVMSVVHALDLLCERIKEKGWAVKDIKGAAAAGQVGRTSFQCQWQQHASVYWSHQAEAILGSLDPSRPLSSQLEPAFSRAVIPNWQDSSTGAECATLTDALGGPAGLAKRTGSSAHTRFTASQILKFRTRVPEAYAATARISLVSSMITTLLCLDGEIKGIDESDACGMNLWNMEDAQRGWDETLLRVVGGDARDLETKLGKVVTDGGAVVGRIGKWFVDRYGFDPACAVFPGTGDNPATLLSLALGENEGMASLGTSDVVLVSTAVYAPHPEYHALFHPATIAPPSVQDGSIDRKHEGLRYFNMLVYKSGSLAREHVRDQYFDGSWDKFNAAVERLRAKSPEDTLNKMAFWWLLPDIIPAGAHGVYKYVTENGNASTARRVEAFDDVDTEALGILGSQLLNYRSRSSAILKSNASGQVPRLTRIYATGGAAANPTIVSLMADVLGCPVSKNVEYDPTTESWGDAKWNACSVGAAYKARWGWERANVTGKEWASFDEVIGACRAERQARRGDASGGVEGVRHVAVPGPASAAYEKALGWWRALEAKALAEGK
ncbi:hypothetical protein Q5752_007012 [Cryptotrichosporon argae]